MKEAKRWMLCGVLLAVGWAGSSWAQTLPIYDATQISFARYRVLERLWVDSWRTAWHIPHAATREAALADLMREAIRVHSDGLVNVYCLPAKNRAGRPTDYYCYGDAIRLIAARR